MKQSAKKAIHKLLHLLFYPVHILYCRRNGREESSSRMELPNHILLGAVRDAIREGHSATILVKGWSMRPFLEHQRDKVRLDNPSGAALHDAVLAEIAPGKYVLHRIIDIRPNPDDASLDRITLMGDGNIKGTEHCLRKDLCGKVTHYIRPNRTIPADAPFLVKNISRWIKLLPIRRYLLVLYKAII